MAESGRPSSKIQLPAERVPATSEPDTPELAGALSGEATFSVTATGTGRTRMNFSVQHLIVAERLAREVADVQTKNVRASFGPFHEIVLGSSVACVILAVACAEAYVNELFADRHSTYPAHDQNLLDLLWSQYELKSALEKFELAVTLRSGNKLDLKLTRFGGQLVYEAI